LLFLRYVIPEGEPRFFRALFARFSPAIRAFFTGYSPAFRAPDGPPAFGTPI